MKNHRPSPSEPPELLPDALLWAEGGHASDVALTALADGEHAIVPAAVRAHVERCTTCTTHLGHAALLSLHVDWQLAARAEDERARDRTNAPRPLPRFAIALGLLVAALGLVPSVLDAGAAPAARTMVLHDAPVFLRGLGTLARQIDGSASLISTLFIYGAAVLLFGMGIAVARLLPKFAAKESSR